MTTIKFKALEFKKMSDPVNKSTGHVKYVCYARALSIPQEIDDWMGTNPRDQKMTTNTAIRIKNSLKDNDDFHELNRGILMSVKAVEWDNKTNDLTLELENPEIHGNIDGGHTLRAILESNKSNTTAEDRFVFFEIFEGLDSPVELAAARNTSVQVDQKSIAELEKSFEVIKDAIENVSFKNRVQYKMNEHYYDNDINAIDVRELISIILMFSQTIYPYRDINGNLSNSQPIQCYSGKEASLKKFLKCEGNNPESSKANREKMIRCMKPILLDIFNLWEEIETKFTEMSSQAQKRYGTRKYSKYDNGKDVGHSFLKETPLKYIIPKGLMYPLIASFRALVQIRSDGNYFWKESPLTVWEAIGDKLVGMILDEKIDNPDVLAKNSNLWSNLFKEVYIYGHMKPSLAP